MGCSTSTPLNDMKNTDEGMEGNPEESPKDPNQTNNTLMNPSNLLDMSSLDLKDSTYDLSQEEKNEMNKPSGGGDSGGGGDGKSSPTENNPPNE